MDFSGQQFCSPGLPPTVARTHLVSPSMTSGSPDLGGEGHSIDMSTSTTTTSHYIPVLEFLGSGWMASAVVFLQQERRPKPQPPSSSGEIRRRRRVAENAARLALSLTRAFVVFLSDDNDVDDHLREDGNGNGTDRLRLGDFYVKFEREEIAVAAHRNHPTAPIAGGRGDENYSPAAEDVIIKLVEVDIISLDDAFDHECSESTTVPQRNANGERAQKYNDAAILSSRLRLLGKILYSVFCLGRPLPSDIIDRTREGVLLHDTDGDSDQERQRQRHNKSSRVAEDTVFARLVVDDANFLPKSVCRFLADMIGHALPEEKKSRHQSDDPDIDDVCGSLLASLEDDPASCGRDTLFASFEDVTLDLEQMVSQPEVYLHDDPNFPYNNGAGADEESESRRARVPMFGQKYHSREWGPTGLMELAVRIMDPQTSHKLTRVQAVFVSGTAGSGKSKFVEEFGSNLSSLSGWIVVRAKFERGMERSSRGIASAMFDGIANCLARMKAGGRPSDVSFVGRVSDLLLATLGHDALTELVDFLPSLPSLSPLLFYYADETERNRRKNTTRPEEANWSLGLSLTKMITAVLESGRYVMLCCDDLQWADGDTLSLIEEVLVNVGMNGAVARRCLFVGLYRTDEFSLQDSYLRTKPDRIDVASDVRLSGLLRDDVVGMLMNEFRLPQRLVTDLADVVHKKTAGHAFFVVELLNSLLRDSVISYSSVRCRYHWDDARISIIRTGDNVAELIAMNIESLPAESRRVLQILSCFGTQTQDSLMQILEKFSPGIISSIDSFVERGILDTAGGIAIFAHDLIQEAAYASLSKDERRSLHLRLGQFLGERFEDPSGIESVTKVFGRLGLKEDQVFFAGRNLTSSPVSLACDQINAVGPDALLLGDGERGANDGVKFARWNLSAGQGFASQSNFGAALFYYSNGIEFLGRDCWTSGADDRHGLCLELHQGVVLASFALGRADNVERFARELIRNVPFEDSLQVQHILLKSLAQSDDQHQECISRGTALLRQLGFDIPLVPSVQIIARAVTSTVGMVSEYSAERLDGLCEGTTDDSVCLAASIAESLFLSLYTTSSPFLPLVACELVKYLLPNGLCPEAACSVATIGVCVALLHGDYHGGRFWTQLARKIIIRNRRKNRISEVRAEIMMHMTIDNFFSPPRDVSSKLISCHHLAMEIGQMDSATLALSQGWRFRLLGGHHLSLILQSFEERLELIAKYNQYNAKYVALDAIFLMELTGKFIDVSSVFGDSASSLDDLKSDAASSKDGRWVWIFHIYQMFVAYLEEDYASAEEHFHESLACPPSQIPNHMSIYQTFFGGLVTLKLHHKMDGTNNQRLEHGKAMIKKLEKWEKLSSEIFENKLLLLQAEHSALQGEHDKAHILYLSSIKSAQGHGNIHELALAHELLGNYYCSVKRHGPDSQKSFRKACVYYEQWGASALADRLRGKHDLRSCPDAHTESQLGKLKHLRED